MRVPPVIKYNLLLHRLHPSILPLSFATEHDPPPCLSQQSTSSNAPDVDVNHANVPCRVADLHRRLGRVGSVFVPHRTGKVLYPIGDEIVGRMLDGGV